MPAPQTTTDRASGTRPQTPSLERMYAAIRAATRVPADWQAVVDAVVAGLRGELPTADEVLREVPVPARRGSDRSQVLHIEPDGSFSVVALVSRPGQATSVHDHTTWCVVAVVAGTECEERFRLDESGPALVLTGTRADQAGAVSGFAPPGDIHRVTNAGTTVGVSLHVYGTDLGRTGSSVRRTYDLPIEPADTSTERGSTMPTAQAPQSTGATHPADTTRQTAGGKVLLHFTMSLDGFVAGPDHAMDWMTGVTNRPGLAEEYAETTGAVLGGRNGWDAYPDVSGIYGGAWQGPVFVLTHHPEDAQPATGVTFLSCDVAEAVRIGLEAAGGKNLEIFSPTIGRQLLERGLIDEIDLHIAPVLLGDGIRLFDNPGGAPVRLELQGGDDPSAEVNVRYRPVRTS